MAAAFGLECVLALHVARGAPIDHNQAAGQTHLDAAAAGGIGDDVHVATGLVHGCKGWVRLQEAEAVRDAADGGATACRRATGGRGVAKALGHIG
jgi:hypothetical protein